MTSSTIQNLYFLTLILYTLTEVSLTLLNLKSASKSKLPESIKHLQDTETKEKSFNYTKDKSYLNIISTIYSSLLIFIFIKLNLFGRIESLISVDNFYLKASLFVFGISFIFSILQLPFSLYHTFIIEQRYGFNKLTFKLWIIDGLKGLLLTLVLTTPLLLGLLHFIIKFEKLWWLYGFLLLASFQISIIFIYPIFIAPLFNKFEKLKDKNLEEAINKLALNLKFETSGLYQMDGSKRSTHGNAYFSGFGKARRIVLFDTLIEKLNQNEICAVLAHEIGHAKKKHIYVTMIVFLSFTLVAFYIASLLMNNEPFFQAFGLSSPSPYALLVLFNIAFEPIMYFISPFISVLSRKNEYEADRYAVDAMGGAKELISALAKLSTHSLSNLTPHPLYSFVHYSHPTLVERIKAMKTHETAIK